MEDEVLIVIIHITGFTGAASEKKTTHFFVFYFAYSDCLSSAVIACDTAVLKE